MNNNMNDYGPMRCDHNEEREADLELIQLCAEWPGALLPMEATLRLSSILLERCPLFPLRNHTFREVLAALYEAVDA